MSKSCLDHPCGILVVDDDEVLAQSLTKVLQQRYACVHTALSGHEAAAILARERNICVVLTDLIMPVMDGLSLLEHVRQLNPEISVILMTGFGTIETAVEAIKRGAEDYVTKPFDGGTVLKKVSRLMELYELKERVNRLEGLQEAESPFAALVAGCSSMRTALERAQAAAQTAAPVLIVGETGTGKEMLARAIHQASPRVRMPFVPVNCAAIPEELVESELFGYRKGAFTGAFADHRGLFQAADGGTLFLDEITEMPRGAQAKLLRVLEHGELRPVGETTARQVDVRVLSASHLPVEELAAGGLREDLFFRISTLVIELPPLRQRREDIFLLIDFFLRRFGQQYGRRITLDRGALERLLLHSFPGNVRELAHVLESAVAMSTDDPQRITERDMQLLVPARGTTPPLPAAVASECSLETLEKFAIRQALRISGGNKSRAAELLGLSRGSLYRKLKEHDLEETESASNPASSAA